MAYSVPGSWTSKVYLALPVTFWMASSLGRRSPITCSVAFSASGGGSSTGTRRVTRPMRSPTISREPDDFSRSDSVCDRQARHTRTQVETSWTRGAGIHHQPMIQSLHESAVRVAEHQDVGGIRAQHLFGGGISELVS